MSKWMDRAEYFMLQQRCVKCGKRDAYTMYGNQRCYECVEKGKEYQAVYNKNNREKRISQMRERYYNLKSQGLCVQCGKEPATCGVKCKACRAKFNEYQRKRLMEVSNDDTRNR